MIAVSQDFLTTLEHRTDFTRRGVIHLASGDNLSIGSGENDVTDFAFKGSTYSDSADATTFPIGTAIGRTIEISLLNDDGQLQPASGAYDFFNAQVELYLDFLLDNGETETIVIGCFTVVSPATWGATVQINATDDMIRTDKPYQTSLPYPATLRQVYEEACLNCGVLYSATPFRNETFAVNSGLSGDYTYRQVFGYISALAGGNARIKREFSTIDGSLYSTLEIKSYDLSYENVQSLPDWISLKYDLNDIAITGLRASIDDIAVLTGSEGYVLDLSNPFFSGYSEGDISAYLIDNSQCFVGKTFRKFDGETFGYPIAEFMDAIEAFDGEISFFTVLTDVSLDFSGKTTLKTSAESNVAQGATYTSQAQKAIIKTKELVLQERTERETAIAQVRSMLNSVRGMYQDQDENGVWYFHDQPELADSQSIIKITADSVAFSVTGNNPDSYVYGFTINGDALLNLITANGILTNWLKTARISSSDDSTVIDLENNEFSLGGGKISYAVDEGGNGVLTINADNILFGNSQLATTADLDSIANSTRESINDLNEAVSAIEGATSGLSAFVKVVPSEPSVTIGTEVGNVRITDEAVQISGSDGARTTITKSRTTTNQLTVENDARFGNFAWITLAENGNLVLKYVGE